MKVAHTALTSSAALATLAALAALAALSLSSAGSLPAQAAVAATVQERTAATHPIHYYVSLPNGWTATGKYPTVVVITDAERRFANVAREFAAARGTLPIIIAVPLVLNGGGNAQSHKGDFDYAPATWTFADSVSNCTFDEDGMTAVLKDLREKFGADDRVTITGFEAGGHVVLSQVFNHPERYQAAVAVASNYQARCVNASPTRQANAEQARIPLRGFHGTNDELHAKSPLPGQWQRAEGDAKARGFANVADSLIQGQAHTNMAAEVVRYFASLWGVDKR